MIRNDTQTLQGRGFLFPAPDGLLPAGLEVPAARFEIRGIRGIELLQPLRYHDLADLRDIVGIELDVRIAGRMNVSLGAIQPRWNFQPVHEFGRRDETRLARLDLLVSGRLQQHRQPADLKLRAGADRQIGAAHARHQARTSLDAMRILQRIRGLVNRNLVAAEFGYQRSPFGHAGENIHCGEYRRARKR